MNTHNVEKFLLNVLGETFCISPGTPSMVRKEFTRPSQRLVVLNPKEEGKASYL